MSAQGIASMTLDEFQRAVQVQAPSNDLIVFICPMCRTPQTARELTQAGAGATFEEVEKYLAFSCIGRFTGATGPRGKPDGKPCDWTLGGLFSLHKFEVVTPDGLHHPMFELASQEEAEAHRGAIAKFSGSGASKPLTDGEAQS